MQESISYIYVLKDPITDLVRYVGQTKYPKRRFNQHLRSFKSRITHTSCWIKSLLDKGLTPIFEVIDESYNGDEAEIAYIKIYKAVGADLCNHTIGGDGTRGTRRRYKVTPEHRAKMLIGLKTFHKNNPGYGTGRKLFNVKPNQNNINNRKAVVQLALDGSFIKEWTCAKEACKAFTGKIHSDGNISEVCLHKRHTAFRYKWKFSTEYYNEYNSNEINRMP